MRHKKLIVLISNKAKPKLNQSEVKTALTVTCLYGRLSVALLLFYYLFPCYITASAWCGLGQPYCTPKWPQAAKAMWTDGQLNHLRERLRSLFIVVSSHMRYLRVDWCHTLCKQSPRQQYLPITPFVRRCVNKFARYNGEPYGLAKPAADLGLIIPQVDYDHSDVFLFVWLVS